MDKRRKKDRRKRREQKVKARVRAAQLTQAEGIGEETGPDSLFSLKDIRGKGAAARLDDAAAPDFDGPPASSSSGGEEGEDDRQLDSEEEQRRWAAGCCETQARIPPGSAAEPVARCACAGPGPRPALGGGAIRTLAQLSSTPSYRMRCPTRTAGTTR